MTMNDKQTKGDKYSGLHTELKGLKMLCPEAVQARLSQLHDWQGKGGGTLLPGHASPKCSIFCGSNIQSL
jgi:hypothetical protein